MKSGRKVTAEKIVMVTKNKENKKIWLETGDENSGLKHILERHQKDFETRGISAREIPAFIKKAIEQGEPIENRPNSHRQADMLKIEGKQYKIVIGLNGYIVTAYPS